MPMSMPSGVRAFAENQPVTSIVETIRALLSNQPVGNEIWVDLVGCVGIMLVAYARYIPTAGNGKQLLSAQQAAEKHIKDE